MDAEFGYVILVFVFMYFVYQWMAVQVIMARKKYNVSYPRTMWLNYVQLNNKLLDRKRSTRIIHPPNSPLCTRLASQCQGIQLQYVDGSCVPFSVATPVPVSV